ncbi:MAG: hypothetical protein KJP00_03125 [Bacteroidia bacterium]|nr:hypothetical protein [Bacteroidia bacterium]
MITEVKIQELSKKVRLLVDNQLTKEDEKQLLEEISQNPRIMDILKREQSLKDFIKTKFVNKKVSPTLIQNIKDKIRIIPA